MYEGTYIFRFATDRAPFSYRENTERASLKVKRGTCRLDSKGCHSIAWRRTTHSTQYESES